WVARCAVELARQDEVITLMDHAAALAPDNLAVLLERADALGRVEAWDLAVKAYAAILGQHADALDAHTRANTFSKLAFIHKQLGHVPQTLAYYQKVLELEPRHEPTLKDLAHLHLGRGATDEAAASLRALAQSVAPEQRAQVLEELDDLAREK